MDENVFLFESLPQHIVEHIFEYISFPEIVRISSISPTFLNFGNVVIRKSFFSLYSEIYKEMSVLKEELALIPPTHEFKADRILMFRSHYVLEMMHSELILMRAVWRDILINRVGSCIPIGKLLHEFYIALNAAKRRNLPPWHINDEMESKIIKFTKQFFVCKLKDLQLNRYLGCSLMDIIDGMLNRQYFINVKYHPDVGSCSMTAVYKVKNPEYLNRPPKLNENGNAPTYEERLRIISYFINLVRINNRNTLRGEQYHREEEAEPSWAPSDDVLGIESSQGTVDAWLSKDARVYLPVLPNPHIEQRILNDKYEFEETYYSTEFTTSTNSGKKFICTIDMTCPINDAPLTIKDCWARMRCNLMQNASSAEFLHKMHSWESIPEPTPALSTSPAYVFNLIVEVSLFIENNFEVCRLAMEEP